VNTLKRILAAAGALFEAVIAGGAHARL